MKRSRKGSLVLLMAAYFLVVFIKLSPSIVMPSLQISMGLSSSTVGLISGAYFFSYAFMQLFSGPLCRRFGAVNVIGLGITIAAVGLILFGVGSSSGILLLGRFLLGLGTGPIFIALLFFLQCNYDYEGYIRNYGISVFVSNMGSAISAAPLKFILQYIPVSVFFAMLSVVSVLIGVTLFLFGKIGETEKTIQRQNVFCQVSKCLGIIKVEPKLVSSLLIWMLVSGGILAYQGLWCSKWTDSAFPEYHLFSGIGGTLVSLGIMAASLLATRFNHMCGSRPRTVIVSGWLQIAALGLVSVVKMHDSGFFLVFSFIADFIFGLIMGNVCLQIPPFVSQLSGKNDNATIMGILNFMANLFTQLVQYVTGILIDKTASFTRTFSYMIIAYVIAMLIGSAFMAIGKRSKQIAT